MRTRQEWVGDWVRSNDTLVRALPIIIGGSSLLAVLLNRAISGIAAVSDASSSQSRADILTLALSALILQPIGDKGIVVIGGDTIRGFTNLDQAWIAMIADKLDATLSKS
ncbi:hypothetical protein ACQ4PT_055969 [Festuca glaucescens]